MDIMLPVGVTIMFADNLDHSNHAGKTWVRTSVGRTPTINDIVCPLVILIVLKG